MRSPASAPLGRILSIGAVIATLALAAACSDGRPACQGAACPIDAPVDTAIDTPADAPPDPNQCSPWFIGEPSAPLELVPIIGGPTPDGIELVDGADLPLSVPPQGGIIALAGVRARNVSGCASQITAALRDPSTGRVVGLESRPGSLYQRADGWAQPTDPLFASLPNLAVCPNQTSDRDIHDQPWLLELTLEDGARSATVTRTIIPRCPAASPFADCACLCAADYVAGTCRGEPGNGGAGRRPLVDVGASLAPI